MKKTPTLHIGLALAALLFAGLACNLFPRVPEKPLETIPVTTEAVENLKQELQDAAAAAEQSGQITLDISETELTSLVAFELQDQNPPPFTDPQIYLRDGQILVTGLVQQEDTSLAVSIAVGVSVSADGQPVFEIIAAELGSLPLPEPLINRFSEEITKAFDESIRPRLGTTVIETISIANGKMTIVGRTK